MNPQKSPRLKGSFTYEEEKKLAMEWTEVLISKPSEARGTGKAKRLNAIESKSRLITSRMDWKNGYLKNLRQIPTYTSKFSEGSDKASFFTSKSIGTVCAPVSTKGIYSGSRNSEHVGNFLAFANFGSLSPSFISDFFVIWKAYLESSQFVVEYVFLCAVAAFTFGYICFPDKFELAKSHAMETDYTGAITLYSVDIMTVIFSIYVVYIVIFCFGVLPILLCHFAFTHKMSQQLRIYSHWALMYSLLGFVSFLCWYA